MAPKLKERFESEEPKRHDTGVYLDEIESADESRDSNSKKSDYMTKKEERLLRKRTGMEDSFKLHFKKKKSDDSS